eukprot:CAMPEP_0177671354 /NCGR_PEP_ID=MMETSP0447-20121125/24654_1 /TAXON_ID=0 /ORGANISM="Stygamoeba regulata, Strain BSH-02190019" /LENGTH=47 /DNA_ID= /DNA_START= /DNA_END= /DNA_ORIENTATION=
MAAKANWAASKPFPTLKPGSRLSPAKKRRSTLTTNFLKIANENFNSP